MQYGIRSITPLQITTNQDFWFNSFFFPILSSSSSQSTTTAEDQNQEGDLPIVMNSYDTHSPYYMYLGGNPGSILVTPSLDGNNYQSWSRAMRRALRSKNKYRFIDGSLPPRPPTDPNFDIWERCNNMGDKGISSFFTELKTLWEDLESLRPMPPCLCVVRCGCGMIDKMREHRDIEYVICFLKGLNDEYSTSRAQILLMEPLPKINKAFSLLIQQERQLVGMNVINPKVLFNAANNRSQGTQEQEQGQQWRAKPSFGRGSNNLSRGRGINKGYGNTKSSSIKICSFCGRERHTVETCYFKHGFPPNMQPGRLKQLSGSVNNVTTSKGKERVAPDEAGNIATNFNFGPKQYAQLASLFQSIGEGTSEHNINQLSMDPRPTSAVNTDPTNQNQEMTCNKTLWILDIEATDHVCPNLKKFKAFHVIRPITITLPNGCTTLEKISGTIGLTD
ncbi:PREDICTED: uncharacterized protein LOC109326712 [Lupinus angustifolius]|uniref:uncharacterized protein LOC109326712 n=1 Tax=Lupinus angustifolius TaxID=3871 RepID=UPI00092E884A|nr:PREDICTED: uncharacterized protein LOC109326712 [Lupinus angustifolius]